MLDLAPKLLYFRYSNQSYYQTKALFHLLFTASIFLILLSCRKEPAEEIIRECEIDVDTLDTTFGITYSDTATYLIPGEQSDLSDAHFEEVRSAIGNPDNTINGVLKICQWVNQNFTFQNAGGNMIGKVTVDELFELDVFYGCHSAALLVSSILRKFGFPAVMIETADVKWAYRYNEGKTDHFAGHVMSEIYVEYKWILLDNNGLYVEEYDPFNPFIPMYDEPGNGYFVIAKGIDTWDYSSKDDSFTFDNLIFFSNNVYCYENLFHTVDYQWINGCTW